jgi:GNAT superfamily N-acetyltransferase
LSRVLLSLEPTARHNRFGSAASDDVLAGHAEYALTRADWIVGAFIGERLRGVVEVYNGRPHGYAEAAFVVEQGWRRRGLGWALLQSAIRIVATSETSTLRMMFSRHNWGMRKLAGKAGGKLDMILGEIAVDVAVGRFCAGSTTPTASE